jgi:hypothetical protein
MILALALCGTAAAQSKPQSGHYDTMTMVVKGNAVSGVFSQERGDPRAGGGPQFSCVFLLQGKIAGDSAKVDTWFPGDAKHIPGTLRFTPDGATLQLAEDQDGCPMTTGTMVSEPYDMPREKDAAADWTGVALVTAKRSVLRSEPAESAKQTPYIVQDDQVAILGRKGDWVHAKYYGEKKAITGWLPVRDLAVLEP